MDSLHGLLPRIVPMNRIGDRTQPSGCSALKCRWFCSLKAAFLNRGSWTARYPFQTAQIMNSSSRNGGLASAGE